MRKKIFTFLLALMASVGMSWADTYEPSPKTTSPSPVILSLKTA